MPNPEKYHMRVTYSDISIPRSVDEKVKEAEFKFKHGLSSPARELVEKEGITLEEAEERIAKDKQVENKNGGGFGGRIARRSRSDGGNPGQDR